MYYLTIVRDGVDVVRWQPFADYAEAIAFTSRFYQVKLPGCRAVLTFTTEAINGEFARSYTMLRRVQDVSEDQPFATEARNAAAKQESSFAFDASYLFVIESEVGRNDREAWAD